MSYQPGDIVLADILDPQGNPCDDPHPALIIRFASPDLVYLAGITSSFRDPPPGHWIRMLDAPGGHPITGLDRPCVLKCDWVVRFSVKAIIKKKGDMPEDHLERARNSFVRLVHEKKLHILQQH